MLRVLRVGDPHAKVSNLDEMKKLIEFVYNVAKAEGVGRIELLGDLFHTHAVLRLEVQEFWSWALTLLSTDFHTVVLVGNHDMSGNYQSNFSALSLFSKLPLKNLYIVNSPVSFVGDKIGYLPYMHDKEAFKKEALGLADLGATVLVCHQTIAGSKYENGFEALDGVELGEWSEKFKHIISGHIHTEQEFDNVIYPGTASWQSTADANKRKGIWIFDHADDGRINSKEFITTQNIVSPIYEITYKEGDQEPKIPTGRVSLSMIGSSEWIRKEKEKFKGKVSIKSKITDAKKLEKRRSGNNFQDFLQNVFPSSMNKEALTKLAKEMGIVE